MKQVLVAEDDPAIRSLVEDALTDAGYGVTAVADGQAALDSCRKRVPDLILLDLSMPVLDGFEFLKRRDSDCRAPVIVMSAAFRISQIGPEMHADGFIEKPFDLGRLIAIVESCAADRPRGIATP